MKRARGFQCSVGFCGSALHSAEHGKRMVVFLAAFGDGGFCKQEFCLVYTLHHDHRVGDMRLDSSNREALFLVERRILVDAVDRLVQIAFCPIELVAFKQIIDSEIHIDQMKCMAEFGCESETLGHFILIAAECGIHPAQRIVQGAGVEIVLGTVKMELIQSLGCSGRGFAPGYGVHGAKRQQTAVHVDFLREGENGFVVLHIGIPAPFVMRQAQNQLSPGITYCHSHVRQASFRGICFHCTTSLRLCAITCQRQSMCFCRELSPE